jgi:large subunit ribosomal protein L35
LNDELYFLIITMQKTKKSIVKRFKITASGKVMRRSPGKRHLLSAKSVKQKRAMGQDKMVTPGVAANVKKAVPFA